MKKYLILQRSKYTDGRIQPPDFIRLFLCPSKELKTAILHPCNGFNGYYKPICKGFEQRVAKSFF